tara:strand:- start:696 stop:1001 length:306 start_codon:yes stop_codon:yes gene_type:complete
MFHQTAHGQPSPWVPDFNSVGIAPSATAELLRDLDGLEPLSGKAPPDGVDWAPFEALGVTHITVHHLRLGGERAEIAVASLAAQGWTPIYSATDVSVYARP